MKKIILLLLLLFLPALSLGYEIHYEDYIKYSAPAWTPDGKIAFIKSVSNGRKYVYGEEDKDVSGIFKLWHQTESISSDTYLCTMNIDGSDKQEVMKITEKFNPGYISWGKEWVVISGGMLDKNKNTIGKIALASPTGKGFKFIGEGREASISPGGDKIVYADKGIWQMDTDGQNKIQLTDNPGDTHPLWSPDGTMVAFLRSEAVAHAELLIYDFKKKEDRKIIESVGFEGWDSTQNLLWVSSGGRQSKIDYEYYVDLNKIDLNGDIVEKLWSIRALQRTFSPDRKLAVGVYRDNQFYVSDEKIQVMYLIKNYQTIEHGRHNRKQKNNVWIKE